MSQPFLDFLKSLPRLWWFNTAMTGITVALLAYYFNFDVFTALGVGLFAGYFSSWLFSRLR